MSRYQWVFRRECGCAFGVLTDDGHSTGQAWQDFFDEGNRTLTTKSIGVAVSRGVTAVKVTHGRYVREFMPQLGSGYECPHVAGPAWRHLPAGHVAHAVLGGAVKALCGLGLRGTGDTWSADGEAKALPKCGRCINRIAHLAGAS